MRALQIHCAWRKEGLGSGYNSKSQYLFLPKCPSLPKSGMSSEVISRQFGWVRILPSLDYHPRALQGDTFLFPLFKSQRLVAHPSCNLLIHCLFANNTSTRGGGRDCQVTGIQSGSLESRQLHFLLTWYICSLVSSLPSHVKSQYRDLSNFKNETTLWSSYTTSWHLLM